MQLRAKAHAIQDLTTGGGLESQMSAISLLFDKGGPSAMLAATEVISALPKHSPMGTAFSQMLLGQVRAQATKSLDGSTADDECKAILGNFSMLINETVISSLFVQRDELNKDIREAVDGFDRCTDDLGNAQTRDVATTHQYQMQKEQEHRECRTHDCIDEMNLRCKQFNDTVDGMHVPCEVPEPKVPGSEMLHFLEHLVAWSNASLNEYTRLQTLCNDATNACNAILEGCHTKQLAFESAYCSWMRTTQRVCHSYEECYTSQYLSYNASVTTARAEEASLKLEYDALKRILCLTDVVVNPNALPHEQRAMLSEECNTKAIDTTVLDVTYMDVPNKVPCQAYTEPQPGTAEFNRVYYDDKHVLEYSNTSFLKDDPNFCTYQP